MYRRSHSREFKLLVVQQAANGENRQTQLCREHHLAESLRLRWRRKYKAGSEAAFLPREAMGPEVLEPRIAEPERFCGQLSMENAVLKKTLGSSRSSNGTRRPSAPSRSIQNSQFFACVISSVPVVPGTPPIHLPRRSLVLATPCATPSNASFWSSPGTDIGVSPMRSSVQVGASITSGFCESCVRDLCSASSNAVLCRRPVLAMVDRSTRICPVICASVSLTRSGWLTSPTSGCRRHSSIWPVFWMRFPVAVSGGV